MMSPRTRSFSLLMLGCAFFLLTGFTSQPADERAAQSELPQSKDSMWKTLGETKVAFNHDAGTYSAKIPEPVKALDRKTIKISGFMLPLEAEEKFKHFLLSKRTPTCPYCPPGEPNEIIEVYADQATEWDDNLVTYEGTFELVNNQDLGVFFKLTKAQKKNN